jgi:PAT family beta-lactamase induction signal transducer AmpG
MAFVKKLKKYMEKPYSFQMLWFGIVSGIPAGFMFSTVSLWLTDYNISLAIIGGLSWTSIPYTLKIFLSPLVDIIHFKSFTFSIGQRRGWILITHLGIALCFLTLSKLCPGGRILWVAIVCFCMTLMAALQDIVLEAYRIELIPLRYRTYMASINAFGFRVGIWFVGYIPVMLAHYWSWSLGLRVMGYVIASSCLLIGTLPEPIKIKKSLFHSANNQKDLSHSHFLGSLWKFLSYRGTIYLKALHQPLFFLEATYGAVRAIGFLGAYKLADVFTRSMWSSFLIAAHYSKKDIANIEKGVGMAAVMIGVSLGGGLIQKKGLRATLMTWGVLQCMTSLLMMVHALMDSHYSLLVISMTLNQLVGGMGSAASISYISSLCRSPGAAEQYALMTSSGSMSRILVTSFAGIVAYYVSWSQFFFIGALTALPVVILAGLCRPFYEHGHRTKS